MSPGCVWSCPLKKCRYASVAQMQLGPRGEQEITLLLCRKNYYKNEDRKWEGCYSIEQLFPPSTLCVKKRKKIPLIEI